MVPVSAALYIPTIVFNCVLFYFWPLCFTFPIFFLFFFFAAFSFIFICFVPFCLFYSFLALILILIDLFLCFGIFKQICYLAKCFVNTCTTYKYALKTASLQNCILHKRKFNEISHEFNSKRFECWRARYDFLDVNK